MVGRCISTQIDDLIRSSVVQRNYIPRQNKRQLVSAVIPARSADLEIFWYLSHLPGSPRYRYPYQQDRRWEAMTVSRMKQIRYAIELLFVVAIIALSFQFIIQPALVSIDPMFADHRDSTVRVPDTPADVAFLVTSCIGMGVYIVRRKFLPSMRR